MARVRPCSPPKESATATVRNRWERVVVMRSVALLWIGKGRKEREGTGCGAGEESSWRETGMVSKA